MTWLRTSDNFASDPVVMNICATRSDRTRVLGWVFELMLYAASHQTDGFIPDLEFRDVVRSRRWRDRLTNPPNGGTALIHQPGDVCDCLKDRPWNDTAADFYIHHYMEGNPSREETDVQRAKQAELRDRELHTAIRNRDRGRCRYCGVRVVWADRRSSVGGVLDHVDPNIAAGAANMVVACRGCNSRKGNRTPDAAGMTLLPVPAESVRYTPPDRDPMVGGGSDQTLTNWSALDPTTHPPVRDGTGRDNEVSPQETSGPGARPDAGPGFAAPGPDTGDGPAPSGLSPKPDGGGAVVVEGWHEPPPPSAPGDAGPLGVRPAVGPASTRRTSRHPNPYRRSGITGANPLDHPGLPGPDDIEKGHSP